VETANVTCSRLVLSRCPMNDEILHKEVETRIPIGPLSNFHTCCYCTYKRELVTMCWHTRSHGSECRSDWGQVVAMG